MRRMNGHSASSASFRSSDSPPRDGHEELCQGCMQHWATIQFQNSQIESLTSIMKGLQETVTMLVAHNASAHQRVLTGSGATLNRTRQFHADDGSPASSKYPSSSSYTPKTQRIRRPNPLSKPKAPSSALKPRPVAKEKRKETTEAQPDVAEDNMDMSLPSTVTRTETLQDDNDDEVMTRIWVTATPFLKVGCPVPDCPRSNFSAGDLYHFKRHFLQIHGDTHPNPSFVFQCPVDDCDEAYENSWKYIKDHMRSAHPEVCPTVEWKKRGRRPKALSQPTSESRKSAEVREAEGEEEEDLGEDAIAVSNLAKSPNGLPGVERMDGPEMDGD